MNKPIDLILGDIVTDSQNRPGIVEHITVRGRHVLVEYANDHFELHEEPTLKLRISSFSSLAQEMTKQIRKDTFTLEMLAAELKTPLTTTQFKFMQSIHPIIQRNDEGDDTAMMQLIDLSSSHQFQKLFDGRDFDSVVEDFKEMLDAQAETTHSG